MLADAMVHSHRMAVATALVIQVGALLNHKTFCNAGASQASEQMTMICRRDQSEQALQNRLACAGRLACWRA